MTTPGTHSLPPSSSFKCIPIMVASKPPCPYRHDVLDDIFLDASIIAKDFTDLTAEFEETLPYDWQDGLKRRGPRGRGPQEQSPTLSGFGEPAGYPPFP